MGPEHVVHADTLGTYALIQQRIGCTDSMPEDTFASLCIAHTRRLKSEDMGVTDTWNMIEVVSRIQKYPR
jgi:hypothetical protein